MLYFGDFAQIGTQLKQQVKVFYTGTPVKPHFYKLFIS